MRPLRILIVMGPLAQGGAEWQLYDTVARLDRERFYPVMASVQFDKYRGLKIEAGDREIEQRFYGLGVPIYRVNGHARYSLQNLRELYKIVQRERVQIVHTNLFEGETWGRLAAILAGKRIVTQKTGTPFKSGKSYNILADWLLNLGTDKIIVVNEEIQQKLTRFEHLPESMFAVIFPGIDPVLWHPADDATKRKLRRELDIEDCKVITAVGRLSDRKAHRYLIEAMPRILRSAPDTRLLIAGDGPLRGDLSELGGRLGVAERVKLLGGRSDVRDLLSVTDVFALPSLGEGSPVVLMEAAFVGVPSVATDVGGVSQVVDDGVTGLVVPPANSRALGDSILHLLSDDARRAEMARAARERAFRDFTVDRMVRQTEAEYLAAARMSC